MPQLLRAIADTLFLLGLFKARREEGAVAMAASGAERVPGRDDPRSRRIAIVDGLLGTDVIPIARPDDPNRGEARVEHVAKGADRCRGPETVGELEAAIAADV